MARSTMLGLLFLAFTVGTGPRALGGDDHQPLEPEPGVGEVALVYEVRHEDRVLRQYEVRSLSQLSYLVGSGGEAVVIDPQRDVERYVEDATSLGLKITKVILTHTHTDFVAGHAELRARTRAEVVIARDLALGWSSITVGAWELGLRPLEGGERDALLIRVEAATGEDTSRFVLTGDAVLVGTVGAPADVGEGPTPFDLAGQIRDAVQVVKGLPADTKILPGHGGGHFEGRTLESYTVTSVRRESAENPFFRIESRSGFLAGVLDLPSSTPAALRRVAALNRSGPPQVDWAETLSRIPAERLSSQEDVWVVDVRSQEAYASGHVLGAVNLPRTGPFEMVLPAVVPPRTPVILVGSEEEAWDAARRLHRVGYAAHGVLAGAPTDWGNAGCAVERCAFIEVKDLARRKAAGIEPLLVDVRSPVEYREGRIAGCVNVPIQRLQRLTCLLGEDARAVMVCKTGYRSGIAVGLAERMGLRGAGNLRGGLQAWREAGLPVLPVHAVTAPGHAAGTR